MRFNLQPSAAEPLYRQIVEQVRRCVASGQWCAGDELPSVRALALEHAINPMTVSKAYAMLEAEGLLERRRGLGMVIAAHQPAARTHERLLLLEPTLQAAAEQARQLGLADAQALALFQRCLQQSALRHPSGDPADEPR